MENISRDIDCSCPFHSLILLATLPCIFFYALTKKEFLCLVTKYQIFHFLSSHNYGLQQTLVFISPNHILIPGPAALFFFLAILSFYYQHKHSPVMWTWNKQCCWSAGLNVFGSFWKTILSSPLTPALAGERAHKVGCTVETVPHIPAIRITSWTELWYCRGSVLCLSASLMKDLRTSLLQSPTLFLSVCHEFCKVVNLI